MSLSCLLCISGNSKQICFCAYYGPSKYILILCKQQCGNIGYNPFSIYKYNIHYTEYNTSRQTKVNIHDYTEYNTSRQTKVNIHYTEYNTSHQTKVNIHDCTEYNTSRQTKVNIHNNII